MTKAKELLKSGKLRKATFINIKKFADLRNKLVHEIDCDDLSPEDREWFINMYKQLKANLTNIGKRQQY